MRICDLRNLLQDLPSEYDLLECNVVVSGEEHIKASISGLKVVDSYSNTGVKSRHLYFEA